MTRRTNLWTHFYRQYGDLRPTPTSTAASDDDARTSRLLKLQPDPVRLRRDFATESATYGRLFALLCGQHAERLGRPRWGDKSLAPSVTRNSILAAYPGGGSCT